MPPKPPLHKAVKCLSESRTKTIKTASRPTKTSKTNFNHSRPTRNPFVNNPLPAAETTNAAKQNKDYPAIRYLVYGTNIILTWCAITWVRDHYIRFDAIRGSSMAPSINPTTNETGQKDWVIFKPYIERSSRTVSVSPESDPWPADSSSIQRGDIVTFWKPHKPEEISIKRVVALEGDTVYPKRGYALNQHPSGNPRLQGMPDGLPDHDEESLLDVRAQSGKIVVPFGYIWVEGDNARKSLDSNDFGPISRGLIKEKAVWIWRDWTSFFKIRDARNKQEKELASTVIHGQSTVPTIFLE